ncbi:SDR family oxidoreductase [Streptomyces mirabilis]|jgi:NAD(P)-dependent dehydrogenase (short-subunit alcohol dehydrogenase family)|uniref:Short chain dehydrogenase n=1 Tax=Streptomyces mirabilis TaxID=68239 RepID=A0A1I2UD23_9ACTN|nr:SDR family oxidoreductase [Streptomyces mirabilis]SFG72591.1 short chain dehydrogenase [Streptomyces mirabilis]
MSKEIVVVIGPGSIGLAIARRVGTGRTVLLAAHSEKDVENAAEQLNGDGYETVTRVVDISERDAVEALADFAAGMGAVTHVVHAAGVSPTQAPIERVLHVDLLGTAYVLDAFGRVIAPGGAGVVVASMAGHRESPYEREIEDALATTPTDQLLDLPFLTPEKIGSTVHAYALSKRANSLRVLTAAHEWGRRGGRVNTISPGVIITPLARDELAGPRGAWFETVRQTCAAKRFSTSDEVGDVAAFLLGPQAAFVTGADLLMDGGVTSALRTGALSMSPAPTVQN